MVSTGSLSPLLRIVKATDYSSSWFFLVNLNTNPKPNRPGVSLYSWMWHWFLNLVLWVWHLDPVLSLTHKPKLPRDSGKTEWVKNKAILPQSKQFGQVVFAKRTKTKIGLVDLYFCLEQELLNKVSRLCYETVPLSYKTQIKVGQMTKVLCGTICDI